MYAVFRNIKSCTSTQKKQNNIKKHCINLNIEFQNSRKYKKKFLVKFRNFECPLSSLLKHNVKRMKEFSEFQLHIVFI